MFVVWYANATNLRQEIDRVYMKDTLHIYVDTRTATKFLEIQQLNGFNHRQVWAKSEYLQIPLCVLGWNKNGFFLSLTRYIFIMNIHLAYTNIHILQTHLLRESWESKLNLSSSFILSSSLCKNNETKV